MPARHTPTGVRPDLDGTRGHGPLFVQGAGEPYLYTYANKSADTDKGLFAKLIDFCDWILKQSMPTMRLHTGAPGGLQTAWAPGGLSSNFEYVNLVTGPHIWFPLDLDHGSTLNSVSIGLRGAIGHAAFPGGAPVGMPNLEVIKVSALGVGTLIGSATIDASPDVATYEAAHVLTVSGLSEVINVGTHTYWAYFQGEYSTNAIAGSVVYQPKSVSVWP